MSKLSHHRIISLREYKGWVQADLAENAGIEPSYISKIERGKAPNVAGIVLAKLATALETSVDYLLGRTDNPAAIPAVNHPALKDPDFHDFLALWPRLDDKGRALLLQMAELAVTKDERRGK